MTTERDAMELLRGIFSEGNRDYIFFGQLLDLVAYDVDEEFLGKSPYRIVQDALHLAYYLLRPGWFEVGIMQGSSSAELKFALLDAGFNQMKKIAEERFLANGVKDDFLNLGIRLRKLSDVPAPDQLPPTILNLIGRV
jgi:hypothetical protein